jgi:hypothetical protein
MMFGNWPEFRSHIQTGKLIAIGMATVKRSVYAPDIPTLEEQGVNIESNSWNGLLAPANTQDAVIVTADGVPLTITMHDGTVTPTIDKTRARGLWRWRLATGATPLPLPIKKVLLTVLKTGSANVIPLVLFGSTVPFLSDI